MIIWIASYPKSGNTWIRSLLTSYLYSDDGIFNFKLLRNIEQFTSSGKLNNADNNLHYQARISKNWIPVQDKINEDNKIHFFKTHNAMCEINGYKFTNKKNTAGVIYIVRDPRNLITSLSHHYQLNINDSFKFLTNKRKIIFPLKYKEKKEGTKKREDFNFLGDWADHYKSWKNIRFCPVKIIRYEDILLDCEKNFTLILNFLSNFIKVDFDKKKINNAIESSSFKNLSKMENEDGFEESSYSVDRGKKIKFFNLGKNNNWKKLLNKKYVNKIETHFESDMRELGYL